MKDENPNTKPEAVVGYGEIRGSESFWDYWGGDSSAAFDLYRLETDGPQTNVSGVTIIISEK